MPSAVPRGLSQTPSLTSLHLKGNLAIVIVLPGEAETERGTKIPRALAPVTWSHDAVMRCSDLPENGQMIQSGDIAGP